MSQYPDGFSASGPTDNHEEGSFTMADLTAITGVAYRSGRVPDQVTLLLIKAFIELVKKMDSDAGIGDADYESTLDAINL